MVLSCITSGIIQGCPASGTLFALGADPFLKMFRQKLETPNLGLVRACADDIGAILFRLRDTGILREIFGAAQTLAHLALKTAKCKLVPLAAEFNEMIAARYRMMLAHTVPEWKNFDVVSRALYLGL
eukprot:6486021-Pyramimonas_sp.AAC.1